jgi:hypothetical protein
MPSKVFSSHSKNSPVHSEGSDVLVPEASPVISSCVESTYLESPPCADNAEVTMHDSPRVMSCTMGNFTSSGYFSAYVVPHTLYSHLSTVCSSANSLGYHRLALAVPGPVIHLWPTRTDTAHVLYVVQYNSRTLVHIMLRAFLQVR